MASSRLTGALVATNIALTCWVLWHERPTLLRHLLGAWRRLLSAGPLPSSASPEWTSPSLNSYLGKDYVPPLPKPVADALERSRLCFLATSGLTNEPHLSLMRFTFTSGLEEPGSEVMIISTRRDTKKFEIITMNRSVALLVHDFEGSDDADASNYEQIRGRTRYSITLNGTVKVQSGELAERYRAIHLASNPSYSQFIVGEDIAIVTVNLERARVCDVNDRVQHFERSEGSLHGVQWTEVTAQTHLRQDSPNERAA